MSTVTPLGRPPVWEVTNVTNRSCGSAIRQARAWVAATRPTKPCRARPARFAKPLSACLPFPLVAHLYGSPGKARTYLATSQLPGGGASTEPGHASGERSWVSRSLLQSKLFQ